MMAQPAAASPGLTIAVDTTIHNATPSIITTSADGSTDVQRAKGSKSGESSPTSPSIGTLAQTLLAAGRWRQGLAKRRSLREELSELDKNLGQLGSQVALLKDSSSDIGQKLEGKLQMMEEEAKRKASRRATLLQQLIAHGAFESSPSSSAQPSPLPSPLPANSGGSGGGRTWQQATRNSKLLNQFGDSKELEDILLQHWTKQQAAQLQQQQQQQAALQARGGVNDGTTTNTNEQKNFVQAVMLELKGLGDDAKSVLRRRSTNMNDGGSGSSLLTTPRGVRTSAARPQLLRAATVHSRSPSTSQSVTPAAISPSASGTSTPVPPISRDTSIVSRTAGVVIASTIPSSTASQAAAPPGRHFRRASTIAAFPRKPAVPSSTTNKKPRRRVRTKPSTEDIGEASDSDNGATDNTTTAPVVDELEAELAAAVAALPPDAVLSSSSTTDLHAAAATTTTTVTSVLLSTSSTSNSDSKAQEANSELLTATDGSIDSGDGSRAGRRAAEKKEYLMRWPNKHLMHVRVNSQVISTLPQSPVSPLPGSSPTTAPTTTPATLTNTATSGLGATLLPVSPRGGPRPSVPFPGVGGAPPTVTRVTSSSSPSSGASTTSSSSSSTAVVIGTSSERPTSSSGSANVATLSPVMARTSSLSPPSPVPQLPPIESNNTIPRLSLEVPASPSPVPPSPSSSSSSSATTNNTTTSPRTGQSSSKRSPRSSSSSGKPNEPTSATTLSPRKEKMRRAAATALSPPSPIIPRVSEVDAETAALAATPLAKDVSFSAVLARRRAEKNAAAAVSATTSPVTSSRSITPVPAIIPVIEAAVAAHRRATPTPPLVPQSSPPSSSSSPTVLTPTTIVTTPSTNVSEQAMVIAPPTLLPLSTSSSTSSLSHHQPTSTSAAAISSITPATTTSSPSAAPSIVLTVTPSTSATPSISSSSTIPPQTPSSVPPPSKPTASPPVSGSTSVSSVPTTPVPPTIHISPPTVATPSTPILVSSPATSAAVSSSTTSSSLSGSSTLSKTAMKWLALGTGNLLVPSSISNPTASTTTSAVSTSSSSSSSSSCSSTLQPIWNPPFQPHSPRASASFASPPGLRRAVSHTMVPPRRQIPLLPSDATSTSDDSDDLTHPSTATVAGRHVKSGSEDNSDAQTSAAIHEGDDTNKSHDKNAAHDRRWQRRRRRAKRTRSDSRRVPSISSSSQSIPLASLDELRAFANSRNSSYNDDNNNNMGSPLTITHTYVPAATSLSSPTDDTRDTLGPLIAARRPRARDRVLSGLTSITGPIRHSSSMEWKTHSSVEHQDGTVSRSDGSNSSDSKSDKKAGQLIRREVTTTTTTTITITTVINGPLLSHFGLHAAAAAASAGAGGAANTIAPLSTPSIEYDDTTSSAGGTRDPSRVPTPLIGTANVPNADTLHARPMSSVGSSVLTSTRAPLLSSSLHADQLRSTSVSTVGSDGVAQSPSPPPLSVSVGDSAKHDSQRFLPTDMANWPSAQAIHTQLASTPASQWSHLRLTPSPPISSPPLSSSSDSQPSQPMSYLQLLRNRAPRERPPMPPILSSSTERAQAVVNALHAAANSTPTNTTSSIISLTDTRDGARSVASSIASSSPHTSYRASVLPALPAEARSPYYPWWKTVAGASSPNPPITPSPIPHTTHGSSNTIPSASAAFLSATPTGVGITSAVTSFPNPEIQVGSGVDVLSTSPLLSSSSNVMLSPDPLPNGIASTFLIPPSQPQPQQPDTSLVVATQSLISSGVSSTASSSQSPIMNSSKATASHISGNNTNNASLGSSITIDVQQSHLPTNFGFAPLPYEFGSPESVRPTRFGVMQGSPTRPHLHQGLMASVPSNGKGASTDPNMHSTSIGVMDSKSGEDASLFVGSSSPYEHKTFEEEEGFVLESRDPNQWTKSLSQQQSSDVVFVEPHGTRRRRRMVPSSHTLIYDRTMVSGGGGGGWQWQWQAKRAQASRTMSTLMRAKLAHKQTSTSSLPATDVRSPIAPLSDRELAGSVRTNWDHEHHLPTRQPLLPTTVLQPSVLPDRNTALPLSMLNSSPSTTTVTMPAIVSFTPTRPYDAAPPVGITSPRSIPTVFPAVRGATHVTTTLDAAATLNQPAIITLEEVKQAQRHTTDSPSSLLSLPLSSSQVVRRPRHIHATRAHPELTHFVPWQQRPQTVAVKQITQPPVILPSTLNVGHHGIEAVSLAPLQSFHTSSSMVTMASNPSVPSGVSPMIIGTAYSSASTAFLSQHSFPAVVTSPPTPSQVILVPASVPTIIASTDANTYQQQQQPAATTTGGSSGVAVVSTPVVGATTPEPSSNMASPYANQLFSFDTTNVPPAGTGGALTAR